MYICSVITHRNIYVFVYIVTQPLSYIHLTILIKKSNDIFKEKRRHITFAVLLFLIGTFVYKVAQPFLSV
jgi:hypothetical protein